MSLPNEAPLPPLGRAIRPAFALDPDWLTVSHGAYGATPRPVLDAQTAWRARMEAQPSVFFKRILPGALRDSAAALAAYLGADAQDLAFVENATAGCNAVLQSLAFVPGDEILVLDHGYRAVRNAAHHVASRSGAALVTVAVPWPDPDPDEIIRRVAAALTPRTRLAILDHVTSPSALVLPIAQLIAECQAAGAKVLVDGAHAPGMLPLDLPALGADWYVGNCHKWLMAPKGSGFLWAQRDRQDGLHPTVISHPYGEGFPAEFDYTGTRDSTAFLSVPAALEFCSGLGGEALMRRNAALAREGAVLLAARFGTQIGAPAEMSAAMATIRLPWRGAATREASNALRETLIETHRTDVPVHPIGDALWIRISAQAFNEIGDYEALADRCLAACA
ncbi:aminotransferase class V-fold PLP-dependent enzyme [Roseomonas sp. HJA6]|uniref:Aminotransferase class V-fold PLP-dependent enzyme n=1 Tax=Roseomonas alba TaxID=2846776 RepID=A0ABS7A3L4_9PROT|nr:aminotransferase class V-fold PLP-dependent enzyme [Neoroseomonas alba]MBW6396894.1 aminotransferase class V-fold PLP-dependent enzyme [Neoroseomonas alba]